MREGVVVAGVVGSVAMVLMEAVGTAVGMGWASENGGNKEMVGVAERIRVEVRVGVPRLPAGAGDAPGREFNDDVGPSAVV
ncbi:hypothetical protein C8R45DRAFT_1037607, partial [Mycena sanguinolenta]